MAVKCQQNIRQLSRTTGGHLISEASRGLLWKIPPWCRKLWGVQGGVSFCHGACGAPWRQWAPVDERSGLGETVLGLAYGSVQAS